jgi:hypothetical protein
VRLVGLGDGIEVQIEAGGTVVVTLVTLVPEIVVGLARSLLDHAERAGAPGMAVMAELATLLGALEEVSIIDEECHLLRGLCASGAHTVEQVAVLISRVRCNSQADW